ncbi:SMC-Scp complex subunit ScpB [Luteolibacter pohnpeiensis]|uniref:SMC-Scp complex subunit ScpB n=1 Tax=Luteolibacter pohnpeiensis TaxID=454153 RepID=A0A934S3Q1_9BACT|nr:SMC-Scp complex subunit ScpB [Luteolibacter pohnpeiensis]MBK1881338.1 SMC-Scp complex subunit ScpB [Luteolibacter pohnpeiensis]
MQLSAIIEALLLASQNPLATDEIARLVRARVAEAEDVRIRETEDPKNEGREIEPLPEWLMGLAATSSEQVTAAIESLNQSYQETERAFTILERPKGWKLYTRSEFGDFVRQLFPGRKPERLSGPAMETLAIVAYRQPITKAAIEAVRGVSCDGMLQKLLDRDLVRIGGRAELPGRPLLYETTDIFFEHFGIRSIDDLPNASELRKVKLPEPEQAPAAEKSDAPDLKDETAAAAVESEDTPSTDNA